MRFFVFAFFLVLSMSGMQVFPYHAEGADDGDAIEVVEEIEVVEPQEGDGHETFLGISEHNMLKVSGPIIWLAMVSAIVTRYIRVKGKVRQLSGIHKACGYTALCLGTLHGLVGLFF